MTYGLFSTLDKTSTVEDLNMEDVSIDLTNNGTDTKGQVRAGAIAGDSVSADKVNSVYDGVIGTTIDNCSVEGSISVVSNCSVMTWGAGILGRAQICTTITNCVADVDCTAKNLKGTSSAYAGGITGSSNVYAGGLFALTNRATVINCYALGDVTGDSENNNKVHIGGLTGQQGGVQVNCYAAGNVISKKTTSDVGGLNGRDGGIAADYNCYYNSEAVQKNGDTVNETGKSEETGQSKETDQSKEQAKVTLKYSKGKPVLSWKKVKGATKYVIYISTKGKTYKKYATTKNLKYTDKKLKAKKIRYYKVKALTSKSSSAVSKYSKAVKAKAKK